jgi:hypothetical protein
MAAYLFVDGIAIAKNYVTAKQARQEGMAGRLFAAIEFALDKK